MLSGQPTADSKVLCKVAVRKKKKTKKPETLIPRHDSEPGSPESFLA